jgi:hypothetical protein
MRRTPLARRTPLKRVRLRKVNPERKAALHTAQFGEDDAYAGWLRTQPCVCCGRWERDRMQCHHVVSRACGGTERDMVPLFWECHVAGHVGGWQTFEVRRGVDLRLEADRLWLRWAAFAMDRQAMGPRNP